MTIEQLRTVVRSLPMLTREEFDSLPPTEFYAYVAAAAACLTALSAEEAATALEEAAHHLRDRH